MIFSAQPAPDPGAGELSSVRRALNTPVVAIAEIPVGPASAAIAVQDDSRGGAPHVTVAVRCQRTAEVVFFTARDTASRDLRGAEAAEAALSLAESMGFLFDDDLVPSAGPEAARRAAEAWAEFTADVVPEPAKPVAVAAVSGSVPLTKFRGALPSWSAETVGGHRTPADSTRSGGMG